MDMHKINELLVVLGALGGFLSFLLALLLEWDNIKAKLGGEPREPEPARCRKREPGGLLGRLRFSLIKTMLTIFMIIVVSTEYLLFIDQYLLHIGPPYYWLLILSLTLGSTTGAYLRARSPYFILLVGILSQVGILIVLGWSPAQLGSLDIVLSGLISGP